jgi:hypothetical protein
MISVLPNFALKSLYIYRATSAAVIAAMEACKKNDQINISDQWIRFSGMPSSVVREGVRFSALWQ